MTDSLNALFVVPGLAGTLAALTVALMLGSSVGGHSVLGTPNAGARPAVTYATDIAPILARECVGCHAPGGSAPFSLLTYEDARSRAGRIADATERGVMPPWLPASEPGTFDGERRLTSDEIELLGQWAEEGAPAGDLSAVTNQAAETASGSSGLGSGGWDPGPADLTVQLPTYTVPAQGRDVYRNLVVPIPVAETRWVEYVELRPGSRSVVHHARMMVDTTPSSRELARSLTDGPGFDGMALLSNAVNPSGHFIGWTPGMTRLPPLEGMPWRLDPGTDLVVQLHFRTSGVEEEVAAQVEFHFADGPPTREPAILVISSLMIDIPAGASDYSVANSFTIPVDVDVLAVYPHAHYLGKDLRATAVLPGGREVSLIHIPNWDFNWQDNYRFSEPISLPAGTTILKQYTYDNSAENPHNLSSPPTRVVYGSNSTDEMADLILQVLPRNSADRRRLLEEQAWKHESEDMAYMAHREFIQGQSLVEAGDLDSATRHFQEALQYRADHVGALVGLSRIFATKGDAESSLLIARQGVMMSNGQDSHALDAMAAALAMLGQSDEAVGAAQDALRLAQRGGDTVLADSLEARIRRYRGSGGR
jgi:mono/diheme cytochrome c family protein